MSQVADTARRCLMHDMSPLPGLALGWRATWLRVRCRAATFAATMVTSALRCVPEWTLEDLAAQKGYSMRVLDLRSRRHSAGRRLREPVSISRIEPYSGPCWEKGSHCEGTKTLLEGQIPRDTSNWFESELHARNATGTCAAQVKMHVDRYTS